MIRVPQRTYSKVKKVQKKKRKASKRSTAVYAPDNIWSERLLDTNETLEDDLWKDSFDKFVGTKTPIREKFQLKKVINASYNRDSSIDDEPRKVSKNKAFKKTKAYTTSKDVLREEVRNKGKLKTKSKISTPVQSFRKNMFRCAISPIVKSHTDLIASPVYNGVFYNANALYDSRGVPKRPFEYSSEMMASSSNVLPNERSVLVQDILNRKADIENEIIGNEIIEKAINNTFFALSDQEFLHNSPQLHLPKSNEKSRKKLRIDATVINNFQNTTLNDNNTLKSNCNSINKITNVDLENSVILNENSPSGIEANNNLTSPDIVNTLENNETNNRTDLVQIDPKNNQHFEEDIRKSNAKKLSAKSISSNKMRQKGETKPTSSSDQIIRSEIINNRLNGNNIEKSKEINSNIISKNKVLSTIITQATVDIDLEQNENLTDVLGNNQILGKRKSPIFDIIDIRHQTKRQAFTKAIISMKSINYQKNSIISVTNDNETTDKQNNLTKKKKGPKAKNKREPNPIISKTSQCTKIDKIPFEEAANLQRNSVRNEPIQKSSVNRFERSRIATRSLSRNKNRQTETVPSTESSAKTKLLKDKTPFEEAANLQRNSVGNEPIRKSSVNRFERSRIATRSLSRNKNRQTETVPSTESLAKTKLIALEKETETLPKTTHSREQLNQKLHNNAASASSETENVRVTRASRRRQKTTALKCDDTAVPTLDTGKKVSSKKQQKVKSAGRKAASEKSTEDLATRHNADIERNSSKPHQEDILTTSKNSDLINNIQQNVSQHSVLNTGTDKQLVLGDEDKQNVRITLNPQEMVVVHAANLEISSVERTCRFTIFPSISDNIDKNMESLQTKIENVPECISDNSNNQRTSAQTIDRVDLIDNESQLRNSTKGGPSLMITDSMPQEDFERTFENPQIKVEECLDSSNEINAELLNEQLVPMCNSNFDNVNICEQIYSQVPSRQRHDATDQNRLRGTAEILDSSQSVSRSGADSESHRHNPTIISEDIIGENAEIIRNISQSPELLPQNETSLILVAENHNQSRISNAEDLNDQSTTSPTLPIDIESNDKENRTENISENSGCNFTSLPSQSPELPALKEVSLNSKENPSHRVEGNLSNTLISHKTNNVNFHKDSAQKSLYENCFILNFQTKKSNVHNTERNSCKTSLPKSNENLSKTTAFLSQSNSLPIDLESNDKENRTENISENSGCNFTSLPSQSPELPALKEVSLNCEQNPSHRVEGNLSNTLISHKTNKVTFHKDSVQKSMYEDRFILNFQTKKSNVHNTERNSCKTSLRKSNQNLSKTTAFLSQSNSFNPFETICESVHEQNVDSNGSSAANEACASSRKQKLSSNIALKSGKWRRQLSHLRRTTLLNATNATLNRTLCNIGEKTLPVNVTCLRESSHTEKINSKNLSCDTSKRAENRKSARASTVFQPLFEFSLGSTPFDKQSGSELSTNNNETNHNQERTIQLLLEPTDDGTLNQLSISSLFNNTTAEGTDPNSLFLSTVPAQTTVAVVSSESGDILEESIRKGTSVLPEAKESTNERRHTSYQQQLSIPLFRQPSLPSRRRRTSLIGNPLSPSNVVLYPTTGPDSILSEFVQLSNSRKSICARPQQLSPRDIVLRRCGQAEPLDFAETYAEANLNQCHKIGEGVYGEVFMYKNNLGETIVLKIIPIEGNIEVNGEPQKKFDEILSEIVIAIELSNLRNDDEFMTSGFVEVKQVRCVQGCYPEFLIDLWELYRDNFVTENDHPEIFPDDQMFIVFELANAGQDLEAFVFQNALESNSAFFQTAITLAVAECKFQFEHRDLHWGNILLSLTDEKEITFKLNGKEIKIPTHGVKATIIDYTLSRMVFDGCCFYDDLSQDDELFAAGGDYQFDIYRFMKDRLDNNWEQYEPYTNILWLHYTIDKMINGARYRSAKNKKHRSAINQMMQLRDELLDFKSASDYVQWLN